MSCIARKHALRSSCLALSTLFNKISSGNCWPRHHVSISRSSGCGRCLESMIKTKPTKFDLFFRYWSTACPHSACFCLLTFAYPYPGRSTRRAWYEVLKKLISCVRPGVLLTRARDLVPVTRLRQLDFPEFERPIKAISGIESCGHSARLDALVRNSADIRVVSFNFLSYYK